MELEPISPRKNDPASEVTIASRLKNAVGQGVKPDGTLQFSSQGTTELILCEGWFDPEQRHMLTVRGNASANGRVPQVEVFAETDAFGDISAWVPLSTGGLSVRERPTGFKNFSSVAASSQDSQPLCFDLLRLPLFSLSSKVRGLRLRFTTPGTYELKSVRF